MGSESFSIASFERDQELDGIKWHCRTWFERSPEHATDGRYSLKAELSSSEEYPGVTLNLGKQDWRGFQTLEFDVYNPGPVTQFKLRIDDRKDPGPDDWFWKRLNLPRGTNRITVELGQLKTYGNGRPLRTSQIRRLIFYTTGLTEKYTIYLDNFTLTRLPST